MPARSHLGMQHHGDLARPGTVRLSVARVVGVAGLITYNWWVITPLRPGWLSSPDAFFSDLSASGQPHAVTMQHLDLAAGLLLLVALVLRGPIGRSGTRPEWKWLVAFAALAALGGRYPYACASMLDSGCRTLERHLELPLHHYVHMLAGIGEFVTVTIALWVAHRRTRHDHSRQSALLRFLVAVLVVGYPLLGIAYFGDRWGTIVEPMFFVVFTVLIAYTLFEPVGDGDDAPGGVGWSHRSAAPGAELRRS